MNITGQSGAGTGYQIKLEIGDSAGGDFHLEGHCQNFPHDIRFTDDDGVTELSYWIEDTTADPITVWVKVADDLGSDQSIYCYYGKSGDNTTSDGYATFEFFDDFEDGDVNNWGTDGIIVASSDRSKRGVYSAYVGGVNRDWDNAWRTDVLPSSGVLEVDVQIDETGFKYHDIEIKNSDRSKLIWRLLFYKANVDQDFYWTDANGEHDTNVDYQPDVWYKFTIKYDEDDTAKFYVDDDEVGSSTAGGVYSGTPATINISTREVRGYVDDFRVRKYADPEPAFSSAGAEESSGEPSGQPFVKRLGGIPFMKGQRFGVKIW